MSKPTLYGIWLSGPTYKAGLALSLLGQPFAYKHVDLRAGAHKQPEYLAINRFGQVPALVDGDLTLCQSGAILLYLADKASRFVPLDPAARYETIEWLMFQVGGIGPIFGQVGFFHKFAGKDFADKRPRDRYVGEAKRLLDVLNRRLAGRDWIMGDTITIADIATFPWVRNLIGFYGAGELVAIGEYPEVTRVLEVFLARPAVQRGLLIPVAPGA